MSVYAISDLHLPIGVKKPMDVFGTRWDNYVEKIKTNWENTVKCKDFVIISGDISWAMYLEEAEADLRFIDELPGTKILTRGNHDYWWTSIKKMNELIEKKEFKTINFIQNDSFMIDEKTAVSGCRGWLTPDDKKFTSSDDKIYKRELLRLEMSIRDAMTRGAENIIVSMHYPPNAGFMTILEKYHIGITVYGHLHNERMGIYDEISAGTKLVSCDYLSFLPEKIIL